MKIVQGKTRNTADIELTPLINIVFLILIFFLTAGTLRPAEVINPVRAESVDLPSSPDPSRTITLLQNGSLLLGDAAIDRQDLTAQLNAMDKSSEVLAIKPDAGLPVGELVALMRVLRQGGYSSVQLLSIADSDKR